MPLISKLYITKNEYYMKIGDINVSNFHIVLIFTHVNEYYTQIVHVIVSGQKKATICV